MLRLCYMRNWVVSLGLGESTPASSSESAVAFVCIGSVQATPTNTHCHLSSSLLSLLADHCRHPCPPATTPSPVPSQPSQPSSPPSARFTWPCSWPDLGATLPHTTPPQAPKSYRQNIHNPRAKTCAQVFWNTSTRREGEHVCPYAILRWAQVSQGLRGRRNTGHDTDTLPACQDYLVPRTWRLFSSHSICICIGSHKGTNGKYSSNDAIVDSTKRRRSSSLGQK